VFFLPALFLADGGENLVVKTLDGHAAVKHANPLNSALAKNSPFVKAAHFTQNTRNR
jgi:hypothetical protein